MKAKMIPTKDLTKEQKDAILEALKFLASTCDGARDLDGQGFSAYDTDIGHSLASFCKLSTKQLTVGARLCFKYRKQLSGKIRDIIDGLKDNSLTLFI